MGAFAGTMGAAAALVAATTPRERVGYSLGILQTGVFSANMLGPVLGGIVAASLGIRESFIFCATLYGIAAVLVFFFVREPGRSVPLVDAHGRPPDTGSIFGNIKMVASERQIVVMLGLLFCLWLSTTFVRPVMPLSIDEFARHIEGTTADMDRVHIEVPGYTGDLRKEAATGVVFGVIGLTSTIAALSVAPLGQRMGYRNTVTSAAVIAGVLYVPLFVAGSYMTFLLFFGAVGLFQGAMVPGTNALIAASTPEGKQGSAFGLAASMQSMALLIGPLSGGLVGGLLGIQSVYLIIGIVLAGAGVAGRMLIREPELFARSARRTRI
jgi:MFS transporter, DHA1 family, multidrug resistance protein